MTSSSASAERRGAPLRVLVVAPVHMVGGQAHAARDIVEGFRDDPEIRATLQAIDPRLRGVLAPLTNLRLLRSIFRPLLYIRQLFRSVRDADVIHVFAASHTAFFFGAVPAIVVSRMLRRPVLLNYHDGRAGEHLRRSPGVVAWALKRSAVLVVPSGYLQEEFARHGFPAEVVPNVVGQTAFASPPVMPLPHRMISLRALEPLYGIDNTLRAFAHLRADYPDLILDIYGGGPGETALRQLARQLGVEGIRFHGMIHHARLPALLAPGGIVVNSSRVDNQPLFILEAFAAGLPVVSTRAGGIPWMIRDGETGILVSLDDPSALAEGVRRLLEDTPLAEAMVRRSRAALESYTWNRVRPQWSAIYRRLGARRGSGSQDAPR